VEERPNQCLCNEFQHRRKYIKHQDASKENSGVRKSCLLMFLQEMGRGKTLYQNVTKEDPLKRKRYQQWRKIA